jgi:Domain of unknown function (DUF1877)
MGMYLSLAALRQETIDRLHADPPLAWQIVAPDDPEAEARARGTRNRRGFLARLFGRKVPAPPPPAEGLPLSGGEGEVLELDKAWQGVHYLLTRTAWDGDPPLNFLLAGGREVGDEEIGIGPARTFTPEETRTIATALGTISDQDLRARFNPKEMMRLEIYPEIWDRDPADDDTLGYLMESVRPLRTTLDRLAADGYGMMVTIT